MTTLGAKSRWQSFRRKYRYWGQLALCLAVLTYFFVALCFAWIDQRITVGQRNPWIFTMESDPALFWLLFVINILFVLLFLACTYFSVGQLLCGIGATLEGQTD